ncbi:hypothetical protein MUK42_17353 [Musa troglodytarum]|uniref:Uncharacterized protein n=1 Tax=Musa troglodytarum TaxID=320322 RepID=A0A9E7KTW3_9LILI|nr:hypothetical protein MUK42_17353 [Musa troglodytarum]
MKGRPGDAVALFSIYEHQIPRKNLEEGYVNLSSRSNLVRGIIMYYRLFRMAAYSLSFFWKRIQRKSYFVVEGLEKYCCLKLLLHNAFMLVVDSYSLMRRKLACPGSCGATSIRTAPGGTELARDGRGSADRQPNRCHVLHVSYQPATYD